MPAAIGACRCSRGLSSSGTGLGPTYIVLEQSPALIDGPHDRRRAGLNHLAFHAGARRALDRLVDSAEQHGWQLMHADQHPFAGGADSYAAYLEDDQGYEVELASRIDGRHALVVRAVSWWRGSVGRCNTSPVRSLIVTGRGSLPSGRGDFASHFGPCAGPCGFCPRSGEGRQPFCPEPTIS